MQDGKALQAGTSHDLGTHFAEAQNIRYQDEQGGLSLAHTTSWGTSTRMIGGVIMTHGDDDGMRMPPAVAPRQIVIVPILRDKPEDAEVLAYCDALQAELSAGVALRGPIRAHVDRKKMKSADKRWDWVRRGAPLIVEIGPRDAAGGVVTFMRRDRLRGAEEKMISTGMPRADFIAGAGALLEEIQASLFDEAKARLDANIRTDIKTFDELAAYFGPAAEDDDATSAFKGWVRAPWSRPTGEALEAVGARLKTLKLTLRNAPLDQKGPYGACLFTGEPGVEEILIGRAY
jgi:prolyl-tRNA synthetase